MPRYPCPGLLSGPVLRHGLDLTLLTALPTVFLCHLIGWAQGGGGFFQSRRERRRRSMHRLPGQSALATVPSPHRKRPHTSLGSGAYQPSHLQPGPYNSSTRRQYNEDQDENTNMVSHSGRGAKGFS